MDSRQLARVKNLYIATAIIWLSSSIGIVCFTGACYIYTWIRYPKPAVVSHPYSPHARASALHTLSPSAAASLFREFDRLETSRMYVYQPWVEFSERVFHSPLLNIDQAEPLPTRRTVEPANGAANNRTIWLFGGSTQFGWGVPDNQTIASHLSAILSTDSTHYTVINHGHTSFYSSQEAMLFETLLRHGHKCDIGVFLDGLNECELSQDDLPKLTHGTSDAFLKEEDVAAENYVIITPLFPPVRVLNGLLRRLVPTSSRQANQESEPLPPTKYDRVAMYRFNMSVIQDIAEKQDIHVSFYWQPTSFDYIAGAEQRRKDLPTFAKIPSLNVAVRQNIKIGSFHFIADMFKENSYEETYVDWGHYGDEGSLRVAQAIADGLKNDGLLR